MTSGPNHPQLQHSVRNDQNWNCFFHNLEAAFFFLATLVLKKEQERQEEDREKETLKKITSLFFFAIFECQALGHVITCFPYFSY